MMQKTDWMPGKRADQLALVLNWTVILTAQLRTAWGIPQAQYNELLELFDTAQGLLQKAQSSERTPVINIQCREAFEALIAKARFFKNHYFLLPPLTGADLVTLGLTPHDDHPTPSGPPTAEVMAETFLVGRHELGMRIVYVSGNPADKANKGYRIWYKVVPPGGEPVTNPDQLDKSFYTRRKKDLIQFDYGDSGKTVYIAVQVENDGKKGPWGPIVAAIIP
ncbi:MAG: hypothetical protein LBO80_09840 [Treponema sp.]|jgi:hypothetical protein|nr:hypothetical protein [Treponema sp.]